MFSGLVIVSTSGNQTLEKEGFVHILQVQQQLSKALDLGELLTQLSSICLHYTEADQCLILEAQEGKFFIQAEASAGGTEVLQAIPIDARNRIRKTFIFSQKMPLFLLEAAAKATQRMHIRDFSPYADDAYVQHFNPRSALCLPIVANGVVEGLIYLENRSRTNAFTVEMEEFLAILLPQIAICWRNAMRLREIERRQEVLEADLYTEKDKMGRFQQQVKLLGEIGQDIAANLTLEDIIESVYENVNTLMDASLFSIGVYNPETDSIDMPATIEKEMRLPMHSYRLSEENRLAVWCFTQAKEVFINDYINEFSRYFPNAVMADPKIGEVPESVIYLPIFAKEEAIGVITVQSFRRYAYSELHLNMLRNLAVYVGIAIENAEAYKRIKASNHEIAEQKKLIEQSFNGIKLLGEIGQDITSNLDVEKIIETVYASINTLIDAPIFSIGIYNEKEQRLDIAGSIERDEKLPFHFYGLDEEERLAVFCFNGLREIVINDLQAEYHLYKPNSPLPEADLGDVPESLVYLPLIGKDKTVGVFSVQSFKKHAYSAHAVNMLRNLGIYIAIALENAEAYKHIEASNNAIAQQRNLIEQAYQDIQLLANIGQDIMASLSVEKIIATVYEQVNSLMDASVFWIGIYNEARQTIDFKGGKEKGETLPNFSIEITENTRLATWCFNNQEEVLINNVDRDYTKYVRQRAASIMGEAPESIVYMPLSLKGKRMGVITVQSFQPDAYSAHHLNLLRNLVNYVFTALENALLYENMEEQVRQRTAEVVRQRDQLDQSFQNIKMLSQIGQDITGMRSTADIISTVYKRVNTLMDATTFGIGIVDSKRERIVFRGALENGEQLPDFHHSIDGELRFSTWALANQKEVVINGYEEDYQKYITTRRKAVAGKDAESILYLPLSTKNTQIGVITVQSYQKNAYTEYHLDILRNLAVYVAIAIENAEAYSAIEEQTEEIERANGKLTASITYANRIQQAFLPQDEVIHQHLPEFFAFFKPRDIVSGDFYWFREQHRRLFLAAMDCTGHGVPGAFMSMIGNDHLAEIVKYLNYEEPDYILGELNDSIREAMHQDFTERREGMDIGLCVIDKAAQRLYFAGAKMPLIYVRNGEMHAIEGDRLSIGGQMRTPYKTFKRHAIDIYPGDVFYLFSDGFQDQFGGEHGRKMLSRNFRSLLLDIHSAPIHEQKDLLEARLQQWMGEHKQIDDIMVLGFKVV